MPLETNFLFFLSLSRWVFMFCIETLLRFGAAFCHSVWRKACAERAQKWIENLPKNIKNVILCGVRKFSNSIFKIRSASTRQNGRLAINIPIYCFEKLNTNISQDFSYRPLRWAAFFAVESESCCEAKYSLISIKFLEFFHGFQNQIGMLLKGGSWSSPVGAAHCQRWVNHFGPLPSCFQFVATGRQWK